MKYIRIFFFICITIFISGCESNSLSNFLGHVIENFGGKNIYSDFLSDGNGTSEGNENFTQFEKHDLTTYQEPWTQEELLSSIFQRSDYPECHEYIYQVDKAVSDTRNFDGVYASINSIFSVQNKLSFRLLDKLGLNHRDIISIVYKACQNQPGEQFLDVAISALTPTEGFEIDEQWFVEEASDNAKILLEQAKDCASPRYDKSGYLVNDDPLVDDQVQCLLAKAHISATSLLEQEFLQCLHTGGDSSVCYEGFRSQLNSKVSNEYVSLLKSKITEVERVINKSKRSQFFSHEEFYEAIEECKEGAISKGLSGDEYYTYVKNVCEPKVNKLFYWEYYERLGMLKKALDENN